ncbi:MAG TPA: isochorismatase family protein, partial [Pirellulales bacterium]|nr:isochorismatase family protein [Pirellulales bacterium]
LGEKNRPARTLWNWTLGVTRASLLICLAPLSFATLAYGDEAAGTREPNRPKISGTLLLNQRSRAEEPAGSGHVEVRLRAVEWQAAETAIVICDVWDDIYCQRAAQRMAVLAPEINRVVTAARDRGVMIVHAPSSTMDVYADTPYRRRMQQASAAEPPVPIAGWCHVDPDREPPLPLDVTNPCDDPEPPRQVRRYQREHPAIAMTGFDGVSDSGVEIYNFCRQEGIKNIAILGVHTNMCVLGRSFGIRQMVRLGRNVVLVRDLTDAMYDPRQPPHVSHARGTELVVEHIERYWCPSIESRDLTRVVEGSDGP